LCWNSTNEVTSLRLAQKNRKNGKLPACPRFPYTYDAENRITQVDAGTTASYTYDAFGRRVFKSTGASVPNECDWYGGGDVFYLYDLAGRPSVYTVQGVNQCKDEIFAGSRHLATYSSFTAFSHSDWLGTERADGYGTSTENCTSNPFGDALSCPPDLYASPLHFTGKERDVESNLDNFVARYNSPTQGRFMNPDPLDILSGQTGDPQGLNLYSYVENNPVSAVDPDGLDCVFVQSNAVWVQRGDCTGINNGTYVAGTVNEKSGTYDPNTGTVGYSYTPYGGGIGSGTISGVHPSGGVSDADRLNAVAQGMQLAAKDIRVGAIFMAENAALEVGGGLLRFGVEALLAARAAKAAEAGEVIFRERQLEHALRVAEGHNTPLGTVQEIKSAINSAIKSGAFQEANGVIKGTVTIQGVTHEFTAGRNPAGQIIFSNIYRR
jgi:RHS repeat-associated protein